MAWKRDGSSVDLVILSGLGDHVLVPTFYNSTKDQLDIGMKVRGMLTFSAHSRAHRQDPFKRGSITCFDTTVASTTGLEVAIRHGINRNPDSTFCPCLSLECILTTMPSFSDNDPGN
jgi:hypothetical protein